MGTQVGIFDIESDLLTLDYMVSRYLINQPDYELLKFCKYLRHPISRENTPNYDEILATNSTTDIPLYGWVSIGIVKDYLTMRHYNENSDNREQYLKNALLETSTNFIKYEQLNDILKEYIHLDILPTNIYDGIVKVLNDIWSVCNGLLSSNRDTVISFDDETNTFNIIINGTISAYRYNEAILVLGK